jgi:hypothetical protein
MPYRAVQALIMWRNPRQPIIRYNRLGSITPLNALASTIRRRWQALTPNVGRPARLSESKANRGSGSIVSRVLVRTAAGLIQSRKMALARQPRMDAGGIRVLSEEAVVPAPRLPLAAGMRFCR